MKGTHTGNRAIFKIGGTTVGAGQNVSFDDDAGLQPVEGLGDVEVQEYVCGLITHKISGEKYFVDAATLSNEKKYPKSADWLTAVEFEVEVIDSVSGKTIEHYTGCKFATSSRRYTKHAITGESFTISARHKAI